jgi:hypothetical protein
VTTTALRALQPNPDKFNVFVPGDSNLGGCGADRLSMHDYMRPLGLRRLDPEADDHDRPIERGVP